jgi:hypothetical protein
MSANISFHPNHHGPTVIKASSTFTRSAPLHLEIIDGKGATHGCITVFLGDFALLNRLIAAINDAAFQAADDIADANYLQAAE